METQEQGPGCQLQATAGQRQLLPAIGGAGKRISAGMRAAAGGAAQTRGALKPLPGRGDRAHRKAILAEATSVSAEVV